VRHMALQSEVISLKRAFFKEHLVAPDCFADIVTRDASMHRLFRYMEAVGGSHLPVLIRGETGTGKQCFAEAFHKISGRHLPFVCLNVAGIDDHLFSDTLFGHVKGAFTGADAVRKGLIEQAEGGILFLDEIGDLSMESQVKLLHLLDYGHYYPIGSDSPRTAHIRILAATNRPLEKLQAEGKFRRDLFYRLQSHQLLIPTLRERKGDIPVLLTHFLELYCKQLGREIPEVESDWLRQANRYSFPGNVRELQGLVMESLALTQPGKNLVGDVMQRLLAGTLDSMQNQSGGAGSVLFAAELPSLKNMEVALIQEALIRTGGNKTLAAELLGVTRQTLNNRFKEMPELRNTGKV
jgi:DNA-binding NtrC family response regulator